MMDNKNKIVVCILLVIYTITNFIGFNKIPAIFVISTSILSALIIVIWLVRSKYYKSNNIYKSLFFIFAASSALIFALDYVLNSVWNNYTYSMRNILYIIITLLFFASVIVGVIGVTIKTKK